VWIMLQVAVEAVRTADSVKCVVGRVAPKMDAQPMMRQIKLMMI
jgi:hypothetical protein